MIFLSSQNLNQEIWLDTDVLKQERTKYWNTIWKSFPRHTHHLYYFNISHKVMHDRCYNVVMCHHLSWIYDKILYFNRWKRYYFFLHLLQNLIYWYRIIWYGTKINQIQIYYNLNSIMAQVSIIMIFSFHEKSYDDCSALLKCIKNCTSIFFKTIIIYMKKKYRKRIQKHI